MAEAVGHGDIFPSVTLDLSFDEAKTLLLVLGKMRLDSELKTYSIYAPLADVLDDYTSAHEQINLTRVALDEETNSIWIWKEDEEECSP